MLLIRVHRFFIGVCILFLLGYAVWEARHAGADRWALARGGLSAAAAVALGIYLKTLRAP